jgi:hypothetical protein
MAEATTTALAPDNSGGSGQDANPYERWAKRTSQPAATPRPGSIPREQYDALPDDQKANFAQLRKQGGGQEYVERSKLPSEATGTTSTATTDATTKSVAETTTDTTTKTTPAPGEKYKFGDLELTGEEIAGLVERKAVEDLRKTQIPADGAYDAKLPAEAKLPGDIKFEVNAEDPAFKDLRAWAQKTGLSQDQFSEALAIYAGDRARELDALRTASAKNLAALGAHAQSRLAAVDQWIRGVVGDTLGKEMRGMLVTARIIEGFEKIINRHTSQGTASFRQDGREPPPAGKGPLSSMSDAEYDALSANEKFRISKMGA